MIEPTIEIPEHLIYFFTVIKSYESNFNKCLEIHNVNTVEILILLEICNNEGLNQVDLVRKFHVTEANISQTTKNLMNKEFITKEIDPNHNSKKLLFLTEKGHKLCEELLVMFSNWNHKVIKGIPMDDLISFGETLELIYANCLDLI